MPLALFGASGYGLLMGRLAAPFLLVQAAAPLVMAFVVDRASDLLAAFPSASPRDAAAASFTFCRISSTPSVIADSNCLA